ncbi:MAG: DUF4301 family protein [Muribaculaceae bacterium]|nr:DUF4301 family protein [Muribaculaceae bacterium]
MQLTVKDIEALKLKGKTEAQLNDEIKMLKDGFPFLKIEAAATPGHGIFVLDEKMENQAMDIWNQFLASGSKVLKMVPASGAASRMFKDLFSFINGKDEKPSNDFMKKFFKEIEKFAFFNKLNEMCIKLYGKSIDSLMKEERYKDIVKALIEKEGLNYGQLPKALLSFHKYLGEARTSIEEHLAEGAQYAAGKDGKVKVHFTVSEDHIPLVNLKFEEAKGKLEHKYGVEYILSTSIQKPSTDTVAANMDGSPYREKEALFFRPGGHGALIENLNDLDGDVIFIKNIDNVVPDSKREDTVKYKKIIGGVLVGLKQKADEYCKILSKGTPDDEKLNEMLDFLHKNLCISHDGTEKMSSQEKADFIYKKLNRPFRVCGMVRNEGEPGGGPFLAYNPDGTVSPQILESTQIDPKNKEAQKMMKEATHFNPVDLVVSTRSWDGKKFDLPKYVDKATGFISIKSREGVEIKALELPGLWNGAMSDWNTILVEVPLSTFNPVKTVNDLLREAHQ